MVHRVYQPTRKPTLDQFLHGLPRVENSLTPLQRRLLVEQYHFPEHRCFASDLAQASGASHHGVVNLQYAYAAQKFCRAAGFQPPLWDGEKREWWAVWSFGIDHPPSRWEWQMHPELATALDQLGWVNSPHAREEFLLPEEIDEESGTEGAARQIRVNAYERDPKLRDRCIAAHGARCSVCGFDFSLAYGRIGEGFIHVHHLRPLGDGAGERPVDPLEDLRPVCPNCHAMLHRRRPPLPMDELRNRLRRDRRWPESREPAS